MKASLQSLCDLFIENRDTLKSAFKWESSYMYPVCANLFCAKGERVDENRLLSSRDIIKAQTGLFSNFRGIVRFPIACMLSLGENPEERFSRAADYYALLKQRFMGSEYLALTAFLLTDMENGFDVQEAISRGRSIYEKMKKEHPFLTSSEDSVFAVLMAAKDQTDEALIQDMEACYQQIKARFHDSNCVQTMSHVLTMAQGDPAEKVQRAFSLYDEILRLGGKYGRHYELATLAALSVTGADVKETAMDILDVDAFLKNQKGYGFFGVDGKTRMMHAAMLVSDQCVSRGQMDNANLTSTLSMIAAQQMAMCAIIAASSASAAAASSH